MAQTGHFNKKNPDFLMKIEFFRESRVKNRHKNNKMQMKLKRLVSFA